MQVLNRTPESFYQTKILNKPNLKTQQVQDELQNKINQIASNDSENIEKALNSLNFSHSHSTSRK